MKKKKNNNNKYPYINYKKLQGKLMKCDLKY